MLLNLLLISIISFTLFTTVEVATTRTDYYYKHSNNYNTNTTNKSHIIYGNYSIHDLFSHEELEQKTIQILKQDLITFVSLLPKFAHQPILVDYLLDKYNSYIYQMETFYTGLFSILHEDHDAETIMIHFIDNINKKLHNFSDTCKTFCLKVISNANEKRIFENFSVIRLNNRNFPPNTKEKKNTKYSTSDIFVSATASFATGDFITPITILTDYLFNTDNDKKTETPQKDIDMWLTYSKLYCVNTFTIQINYHHNHIYIIGDKIPYEYTTNFISIIQYNIQKQLTKFSKDSIQARSLENLMQQFQVIKLMVYKIEEKIVLDLYDKLTNIMETTFINPFITFKEYIDQLIIELYDVIKITEYDFPMTYIELKEQQRITLILNQIMDHIKAEVARENKLKQDNIRFAAEQRVNFSKVLDDTKIMEFEVWVDLYIYSPLKRTGVLFSKAIISIPEGITLGGIQGVYIFLQNMVSIFIYNPLTTSIIVFITFTIVYTTAVNGIMFLTNFLRWMMWWVLIPFHFLHKIYCFIRELFNMLSDL
jgi:hypothetical protein